MNMRIIKALQDFKIGIVLLAAATTVAAQTPKMRVLVIVTSADHFSDGHPTGLWLEEFAAPYQTLIAGGAHVAVFSPKGGQTPIDPRSNPTEAQATEWQDATRVLATAKPLTSEIRVGDYDAIFLPGGHGPMFDLANDPRVAQIVTNFVREGKIVAAICHGPAALAGAKQINGHPFVEGKRLTGFTDAEERARGLDKLVPFSLEQRLTRLGANFQEGKNFAEHTEQDGLLITGQNPQSSAAVGKLLLQALQSQSTASSVNH
jgi:putative intracellular protease/amidase